MDRVAEYRRLLALETELRAQVISTQNSAIEEQRIAIALQRETLLFELTEEELRLLR